MDEKQGGGVVSADQRGKKRCSCGDPTLERIMGARVTHTPDRCGFTTGPVEHLRVDLPGDVNKDDALRQIALARPGGTKS